MNSLNSFLLSFSICSYNKGILTESNTGPTDHRPSLKTEGEREGEGKGRNKIS